MSATPSRKQLKFEMPIGYTKKEKRQAFYLSQLNELNDVPNLVLGELARQEDVEPIGKKQPKPNGGHIKTKLGPIALKKYN